jgi:probable addiction module antidote protein
MGRLRLRIGTFPFGTKRLAQETELGRESLYKTLSENGNPQFITIYKIRSALGLEISFQPTSETANLS